MKFIKGVVIGSIVTAGAMMLYSGNINDEKKKWVKNGKKLAKKIGLY